MMHEEDATRGRADRGGRAAVGFAFTLVQLRERVEALLLKSEQVEGEALRPLAADQGGHQGGLALDEGTVDHCLAEGYRS